MNHINQSNFIRAKFNRRSRYAYITRNFNWVRRGHRGHAYLMENKRTSQGGPTGDERGNRLPTMWSMWFFFFLILANVKIKRFITNRCILLRKTIYVKFQNSRTHHCKVINKVNVFKEKTKFMVTESQGFQREGLVTRNDHVKYQSSSISYYIS